MSPLVGLESAIPEGDRLLLDTTVLAAYLDGSEATHSIASRILDDFVANGRNDAIVSMVTIMEILVRPLRASPSGHHTVLSFIRHHPHLEAVPFDLQMAQEAASLRAGLRFSPPDSMIVATGLACQVSRLVTNDSDWVGKLKPIRARVKVVMIGVLAST